MSFIEIYNEEVRDLLVSCAQGSGAVLALREDPRHGVCVNANESFVTDLETLISIMYAGNVKNQQTKIMRLAIMRTKLNQIGKIHTKMTTMEQYAFQH